MLNIRGHFVSFSGSSDVRSGECARPDDPCLGHSAYQCVVCGEVFVFCRLAGKALGQGSPHGILCSEMGGTLAEVLLHVVEQGGKFDPHCDFKELVIVQSEGDDVVFWVNPAAVPV